MATRKHKADKIFVSRVFVKGSGTFPIDMLRYDGCVPFKQTDANAIMREGEERVIELKRYCVNDGPPTVDRWHSFGWTVVSVETMDGEQLPLQAAI